MSDCRNPHARWPTAEIMRRARMVDDTGLIPFVDTEAAARYLALSPHSLECYARSVAGHRSTNSESSSVTLSLNLKPGLRSADIIIRLAAMLAPTNALASI